MAVVAREPSVSHHLVSYLPVMASARSSLPPLVAVVLATLLATPVCAGQQVTTTTANFAALYPARARLPHPAADLLTAGPVAELPLPDGAIVDAVRRTAAARLLTTLRTRARTLLSTPVPTTTVSAAMARWSSLHRQGAALIALARRVAEARDVMLTAEALTLVGEAFEAIARAGAPMDALADDAAPHCGWGDDALTEEVQSLVEEIRTATRGRPALVARLRELVASSRSQATARERRRRAVEGLDRDDVHTLRTEADAARQAALVFYATALQISLTRQSVGPAAWRALERIQDEQNRPLLDLAMRHQSLVTDHAAWATMLTPGVALLESAPFGPTRYAP